MKTTSSLGRILFGGVLLLLGIGFLLGELGVMHISFDATIGTWWPLAIIVIGLLSLLNNPRHFSFPLFILLVGILLQFQQLDLITGNFWGIIWPTALIVFGLSLFFEQMNAPKREKAKEEKDDATDLFVAFSGSDVKSTSKSYRGGKATALFGGFTLDLRHAELKHDTSIDIFIAFGGGDIIVPKGWHIKTSGIPIFGGWEDKTDQPASDKAPTLNVRGSCLFGGVTVKHEK